MRTVVLILAAVLTVAGCGASPAPAPAGNAESPAPAFNDTDVMFLQMSLEYIRQGDQVAALAEARGAPEVRGLATELRAQWRTEAGTMQRWLLGWQQPLTADPSAGAHAGHGDLHSLRPRDIADLTATDPAGFDRAALTMLVGHLHNCVEVTRMETAGGRYPPAKALAAAMTRDRQAAIQRMLPLVA